MNIERRTEREELEAGEEGDELLGGDMMEELEYRG